MTPGINELSVSIYLSMPRRRSHLVRGDFDEISKITWICERYGCANKMQILKITGLSLCYVSSLNVLNPLYTVNSTTMYTLQLSSPAWAFTKSFLHYSAVVSCQHHWSEPGQKYSNGCCRFEFFPKPSIPSIIQSYGVVGDMHAWFTDYLKARSQRVLLDGVSAVTVGLVPRGSILGPTLFVAVLDDLTSVLSECTQSAWTKLKYFVLFPQQPIVKEFSDV